jgi:hypothetical protein
MDRLASFPRLLAPQRVQPVFGFADAEAGCRVGLDGDPSIS